MKGFTSLPSQQRLTAEQAIADSCRFKVPVRRATNRLFEEYAATTARSTTINRAMTRLMSEHFRRPFEPPSLPVVRSAEATQPFPSLVSHFQGLVSQYAREFAAKLREQGFGIITWHDEQSCVFDYPEVRVTNGLTQTTYDRYRHTHDVVKARQHKLPATDVRRPAYVDTMIARLPAELHPQLRIVSGLEVVRNVRHEKSHTERNALGRFFDEFKGSKQVSVPDPALCLGEIVLCGWEG